MYKATPGMTNTFYGGLTSNDDIILDAAAKLLVGDANLYNDISNRLATDDALLIGRYLVVTQWTRFDGGFSLTETPGAARQGTVVMNGTTPVTVNTSCVYNDSLIFLTHQVPVGPIGVIYVESRVEESYFTVNSKSTTDFSTVGWMLINRS